MIINALTAAPFISQAVFARWRQQALLRRWNGDGLHISMAEFTVSVTGIKYFYVSRVLLQVHVVRSSDQLRSATCMSWMLNVSYL